MSETQPTIPLTYSTVIERRAPIALYHLSMTCAIGPMVAGLFLLVAFWLTQIAGFAVAGFFGLFIGGGTVLMGFIFSAIYLRLAKSATADRETSVKRAHRAQYTLLATIPVAIFCTFVGFWLVTYPVVDFEIHNIGKSTIDSGSLIVGNKIASIGAIPPQARFTARMRATDPSAKLLLNRPNGQIELKVDGRATTDFIAGGRLTRVIEVKDEKAELDYSGD